MTTQSAPPADVRAVVEQFLVDALRQRASDLHVEPQAEVWDLRFRIDGMLRTCQRMEAAVGRSVVARLMVLAKLLTYRPDVPQEGRISFGYDGKDVELRLSVMPTVHGLRAAIRMPAEQLQPATLEELGLPSGVLAGLNRFVSADSGMLILTGPAGSGKTTTIYALLAQIVATQPGLSVIALEDPVERHLSGVTQIEVSPFGQLTYERALRSILRQDPQVLMLGEIRDAATATQAVQAALSGHRLITTLHASTPAGAIGRLWEMGIEPYQLTSSLHSVLSQRLARRKSESGYHGRVPVAELVTVDSELKQAILRREDADAMAKIYSRQPGYQSLADSGQALLRQGITDEAELARLCLKT
jgi:type II secretory ATPase GspE/PulE/Tfp pilus assembly ATPase PilB-like protein